MTSSYRILIATTLLLPMLALAQEAGTPQYNSVFLPAHGAGDTRRAPPDGWGAWARGDDKTLGWTFSGRTEEEARQLAVADCIARGSQNCQVVKTFGNACAAVAAGPNARKYYITPKSQRAARREALKACGPDCKIVFEGCAMP